MHVESPSRCWLGVTAEGRLGHKDAHRKWEQSCGDLGRGREEEDRRAEAGRKHH